MTAYVRRRLNYNFKQAFLMRSTSLTHPILFKMADEPENDCTSSPLKKVLIGVTGSVASIKLGQVVHELLSSNKAS